MTFLTAGVCLVEEWWLHPILARGHASVLVSLACFIQAGEWDNLCWNSERPLMVCWEKLVSELPMTVNTTMYTEFEMIIAFNSDTKQCVPVALVFFLFF